MIQKAFLKDEWKAPGNIVLTDGRNDLLLVYEYPGVYQVHYFFDDRGKAAISAAKDAFHSAFSLDSVRAVFGLIPEDNRKSRWFTRHLGIKSYGMTDTSYGRCEMFVLTKEEHATWAVL